MNLDVTNEEGLLVLAPKGPMNALTSSALQDDIRESLDGNAGNVVLDLAAVPFVSSQGLRVVIQTAKLIQTSGTDRKFFICGLQPSIEQIFRLAGIDRLVEIRASLTAVRRAENCAS